MTSNKACIILLFILLLRFSHCVDVITTIAGTGASSYSGDNGQATSAGLYLPYGLNVDTAGNEYIYLFLCIDKGFPELKLRNSLFIPIGNVYIADTYNQRIRKVAVSTGIITTIAGTGSSSYSGDNGPATSATLCYPIDVAVDSTGKQLYF